MSWRSGKTTSERGYSSRWRTLRARFLRHHPLCRMCADAGKIEPATVVDHIKRHQGSNDPLFWDESNWQPLCKSHHDSAKKREDRTGSAVGCAPSGLPLDKGHHWFKR